MHHITYASRLLSVSIILIALGITCNAQPFDDYIFIGIPITLTGRWNLEGASMQKGFDLWIEKVNSNGGILLPNPYNSSDTWSYGVNATYVNVGDSTATTKSVTQAFLNGTYGPIDFMFAPYSSTLTPVAAQVTESAGMLLMSGHAASETVFKCDDSMLPPCTQNFGIRFNYLYSVISPATAYFDPFLQWNKIKESKNVVVFYEDSAFTKSLAEGAEMAAEDNGISVLAEILIPSITNETDAEAALLDDLIEQLAYIDPDSVVGGTYFTACELFVKRAKANNYLPKALSLSSCAGEPLLLQDLGEDIRYITGPTQWDKNLKGREYTVASTDEVNYWIQDLDSFAPQEYNDDYKAKYGDEPSYQAAAATAMGVALQIAIIRAKSLNTASVKAQLDQLDDPSFFGTLGFDQYHMNSAKYMILNQYDKDESLFLIFPLSAAEKDMIYPMPSWDVREYHYEWFKSPEEAVVITAVVLCMVYIMAIFAGVVRNRKSKYIVASSTFFCYFILIGAWLVCGSILLWGLECSDATCIARIWIAPLGATLMFSCLLAKEWRVYRLFNSQLIKQAIPDRELLIPVGVMMGIQVLILILWTAIYPPYAKQVVVDTYDYSNNYHTCDTQRGLPFLITNALYMGIWGICGMFLSWKTRNAPSRYSESRYITMSAYNLAFCALILLVLIFVPIRNRSAAYILRSICMLFGVVGTVSILFVPKFLRIWKAKTAPGQNKRQTRVHQFIGGMLSRNSNRNSIPMDVDTSKLLQRISELEEENQRLRASLNLEVQIPSPQ